MQRKISMNNHGEKTVREAYDLFIRSRQVMNVSDDTIRFYNVSCKWFLEYVGENELCKNITGDTVTSYMFHLKETKPNLSSKSFSTYIRALRAVLNYCMENGFTEKFTIKLPKADETIKEVYTDTISQLSHRPYPIPTGNAFGSIKRHRTDSICKPFQDGSKWRALFQTQRP